LTNSYLYWCFFAQFWFNYHHIGDGDILDMGIIESSLVTKLITTSEHN